MDKKPSLNSLSIKNIISIVFMALILTTAGGISLIIFSKWQASAREITTKMAKDLNAEIYQQIEAFLNVPEHVNAIFQTFITNGIVDINNETEREFFLVDVVAGHRNDIYAFSYGLETGEHYGALINKKGIIEIMRNNASTGGNSWYYSVKNDQTTGNLVRQAGTFDPRTRDWYQAAKIARKPLFSPIHKYIDINELAVSAVYPIISKTGELQGVLGTHVFLSSIDSFLKEIVRDKNGFAVIAEKDTGELIANSFDTAIFSVLEGGAIKRYRLGEIENKTPEQAYEYYQKTGESRFLLDDGRGRLYLHSSEFHKDGLDWIIITAIPDSLLMAGIAGNMQLAFVLVGMAVVLSTGVYFNLITRLLKPVGSLMEVTEKLTQGDLSHRAVVVRNDEIGRISSSFNKMADMIHMLVDNLEATVQERTAELKTANSALENTKNELRLILDSTAEAIYGVDRKGNCTFCNVSCLEKLGYRYQDELLGQDMHLLIHHSRKDGSYFPVEDCKIYKSFMDGKNTYVDDEVLWRADGTSFDAEYHSYPQFKDGEIIGAVVTFMNITERKKAEDKIQFLNRIDSLTGVYNRRFFEEALKKIDTQANLPISIIFGDVNGLKLTNDIFGHAAGDALIKKAAEKMKMSCRDKDIVARVGGDEFIILLPNTSASDAQKIIARVKQELAGEMISAIKCSMSMGCDTKTSTEQGIERIMANAEYEMYAHKTLGRKTIQSDLITTIISTLHDRSPHEKQHSETVSELCKKIGQAMKLPETEVKKLTDAGYFHDIGKIILPDNILNKDGLLTEEEKKEMQQHAAIGYRILNLFDETLDLAEGVYGHHEKWDGSGYPKGLKRKEIPLPARILAVVEWYAGATNNNSKIVKSKTETLREIQNLAGVTLDPEAAHVFVAMMTDNEDAND